MKTLTQPPSSQTQPKPQPKAEPPTNYIHCVGDLRAFGVHFLTGEACGYSGRLLFDVTEQGHAYLQEFFGVRELQLARDWNGGDAVGSIMLSHGTIADFSVFCLLKSGFYEVWHNRSDGSVHGINEEHSENAHRVWGYDTKNNWRVYRGAGTAGMRNRHEMSGRVS